MKTDERRVVYTVVAVNVALAIWLTLILWLQSAARSSMPPPRNQTAFLVDFWLDIALVLSLMVGALLEFKKQRLAVWFNLIWPVVSSIVAPLLMLAESKGDTHRKLVINAAVFSVVSFIFFLILRHSVPSSLQKDCGI